MSHSGHKIVKCSCGVILSNCRCMAPDKMVEIVQNGCDDCKQKASEVKG